MSKDTEQPGPVDVNRAKDVDDAVAAAIRDMFEYHKWTPAQEVAGQAVRNLMIELVKMIVAHVPPCPDRTVALRKLREARMDCNSAITHNGRY